MTVPDTPAGAPSMTREDQLDALAEVFGEEYASDFQDPVVFRPYVLSSPVAKQFYRREFPLVSRTLFVESVYRRRPDYNQEVLDAFAAISAKKLGDILQMLTTQCDRLTKMCISNGAMLDAEYLHPKPTVVPIIAAHANTYMRCLTKLDSLYQLSGSATLNGVIDGGQRRAVELLCRKAVRAYGALLRNESHKLRKESHRMREVAGIDDPELTRAEGAQEKAIETFDQAITHERQLDSSAHVDPSGAASYIEDASATTAAAAKSMRKKKDPVESTPADFVPVAAGG